MVIDTSPEEGSVTPAKNCKAPVAPDEGINDIIELVKSVPEARRINLSPEGSVSLISSTTTSETLLEFVSLIL